MGLNQWAGSSGLTAWGVREFYYGPNVRALSQYYGAPLEIRIQASQMRNDIVTATREITPQPYKSMAEAIKGKLPIKPDGNFAKPNPAMMWKMRGVGAGSSLLMGYGIYQSAKTISNASNRSTAATQQSIIWINSLAFGSLGASAGAALGAGFFGIGAAPGAIIGGVVGSIGGGIYGSWLSSNFK
jgi:hypothetical protein